MDEDTSYTKLPVEERCVHKVWKARVDGYEEAAKIFKQIDEETSPEWNKFLGLIKKFVVDSHAMAQEKGLEATLVFVEMCGFAGKTAGEVVSGIVAKCLGSPKAKVKDVAGQIVLMYIEIERQEQVLDELIKGLDNKNPKIVATITALITRALHEFGRNVITLKPLVKKIPALLADRDKTVRDETKLLTIEMFRWIGAALRPQLAAVNEVLLKELDAEFEKVKGEQPVPSRYLRSQQAKAAARSAAGAGAQGQADDEEGEQEDTPPMDPMDLIEAIDILSKLPKDFYEKLESKKWQERKESLDALDALLQHKKFESGDYGDLVRALKKVLTKDSNVVLVALSGKCIALLATGLGKKFNTYAGAMIPGILEKFKEKKANVVAALRDAIDAIYPSTSLEAMQEDLLEALNNKNPSVKCETCLFLARALSKTQPAALNKKLLKTLVTALLKTLNESDPTVRDASAEALGTAMKLVGEKVIGPCLTEVDALKMNKIKECCEKAVITVKIQAPKKERPTTAPSAPPVATVAPTMKGGATFARPVARPATAGPKKATVAAAPARKATASSGSGMPKSSSSSKIAAKQLPSERDLSPEEVDEKVADLLPGDVTTGLVDANWKTRLAAVESCAVCINDLDNKNNASQVLVRTLAKKPGLKDTNFQVLKIKLDILRTICEAMTITVTTADYIMGDVIEKLADAKNSAPARDVLTAIADCISLEYVVTRVLSYIFEQKSPKLQQEGLLWISGAIREFGFQLNPKMMIDDAKKAVQSTNPTVRGAGITLLGTLYLYMGPTLASFFDSEKPALKAQIDAEFERNQGQRAPAPTRGSLAKAGGAGGDDDDGGMDDEGGTAAAGAPEINLADLLPRVDIAPLITEALLAEMADKNWKTRNEALTKLQGILDESKLIKANIGDLPQAMALRLKDSNTKIAQLAILICEQLATCIGPPFKQHIKVLFPGILLGLGDSKSFLRQACAACIATWSSVCGYKEFFECEMIAESLKTGGPVLRVELWGWLAEKLPDIPPKTIPKDELLACLPYLFANICDRNADVRKNANEAILGFMMHVGYDAMAKAMDKQTPTLKKDIKAALDKARPNLPVKPLPQKQAPVAAAEARQLQRPGTAGSSAAAATAAAGSKLAKPGAQAKAQPEKPVARKKEEEVDTSPLLAVNNTKNQRMIDEQKLKVLKWTFTAPREEFNELLRDQMTTANVNKNLLTNMFHVDFRYHLKVIDALAEDLPGNVQGLVCNLDLVLKWISLRFYDTNPSVLIKGLDYLVVVLETLIENEYALTDIEANSFVPHLLTKIGDPKDAVKNGVRTSIRKFCRIYPYVKMFAFVMEGLKSKNARQRTECLDELGYLIAQYGLSAMTPSPQAALKEIAKQISDRDNSVRNAALNCIVQAYYLVDDKIYKFIGQISDKDMSMLDERIKRAKKTRPMEQPAIQSNTMKVVRPEPKEEVQEEIIEEEEVEPYPEGLPTPPRVSEESFKRRRESGYYDNMVLPDYIPPGARLPPPPVVDGPFKLDMKFIEDIEKDWIPVDQMPKREPANVDLSFLYSPLKVIEVNGVKYPEEKFNALLAKSIATQQSYMVSPPSTKPSSSQYYSKATAKQNLTEQMNTFATMTIQSSPQPVRGKDLDPDLLRIFKGIGSEDHLTARAAMRELDLILDDKDKHAILIDYEQEYIFALLRQFEILAALSFNETMIIYQQLLNNAFQYFSSKVLCQRLSIASLKSVVAVLLGLMAETRLSTGGDTYGYTKVVNCICLKTLENSNFTSINCALIILLRETCQKSSLPKFTELLMKCIWRNLKMMPDRASELEVPALLREIHLFLVELPPCWWVQRPSDTPYRTIRTIIHSLTKIRNTRIFDDIPEDVPRGSELFSYITRLVKTMTMDTTEEPPAQPSGNTDPEFWMKRLREIKRENIPQSQAEAETRASNAALLETYILRAKTEKTPPAPPCPTFKEQLDNISNPNERLEFLQKKLAQVRMMKIARH